MYIYLDRKILATVFCFAELVWPEEDAPYSSYRKVRSTSLSRLEAHAGFFRLLMKGIFGPYVL